MPNIFEMSKKITELSKTKSKLLANLETARESEADLILEKIARINAEIAKLSIKIIEGDPDNLIKAKKQSGWTGESWSRI